MLRCAQPITPFKDFRLDLALGYHIATNTPRAGNAKTTAGEEGGLILSATVPETPAIILRPAEGAVVSGMR